MAEKSTTADQNGSTIFSRGVKIAGETLVAPGSSLILDGKIAEGSAHLVGGLVARAFLGPIGCLLVAANSYSKSVTGKNVTAHFTAE